MASMLKRLMLAAPIALIAGCASTPAERPAPAPAQAPISRAGLESVIGASASALTGAFGTPDLDVREGTAQKLQFSSSVCVLDTYLYPRSNGSAPVVTHIDARFPDGRDMDRASCVAALKAKAQAR